MEQGRRGDKSEIKQIDSDLWRKYQTMALTPIEELELLGWTAGVFRGKDQPALALRWYERLCERALEALPESDDIAWAFFYKAECLEAVSRQTDALQALRKAREIATPSSELADKIRHKLTYLTKRL